MDRHAAEHEFALQRAAQTAGDLEPGIGAAGRADEHRELVAAEAREEILGPHLLREPVGHLTEQLVAALMPQDVIDLLEAIEVHEQEREVVGRLGVIGSRAEQFVEAAAVGQPGQLVVQRAMAMLIRLAAQLGLVALALLSAAVRFLKQSLLRCAAR